MAPANKTIRVRCAAWEQVESFYTQKLRGNAVVVKMPYRPEPGEMITVALGLPDGMVFTIDGTVVKVGADDGGKVPVALRLAGLGAGVREQLERLVAAARRTGGAEPAPEVASVPDVLDDERDVLASLEAERTRRAQLPAHELLGVAPGADLATVRRGYLAQAKKLHPDAYGRYRSPAVRRLVESLFAQVARAFDRLREVAPAQARVPGPAFASRAGWLLAVSSANSASSGVPEPVANEPSAPYSDLQLESSGPIMDTPPPPPPPAEAVPDPRDEFSSDLRFTTSVRLKALTAEDLFEDEVQTRTEIARPGDGPIAAGRAALAAGQWREACVAFATALRNDPKDRAVRALYHVANGMELREKGDGAQARLQFETALAHDRQCDEARRALQQQNLAPQKGIIKRFFDR